MEIYDTGWEIGDRHACKLVSCVDATVDGGIYLSILRCPVRGTGSQCLASFIATFRRLGFRRIRLDAYPMGYQIGQAPAERVGRLVAWYERFGFRLSQAFRPDYYNEMVLDL
jgi:hypothetical protein